MEDVKKVKIELSPCDAMIILAMILDVIKKVNPNYKPFQDAINAYENELQENMTDEQIDDADKERQIKQSVYT